MLFIHDVDAAGLDLFFVLVDVHCFALLHRHDVVCAFEGHVGWVHLGSILLGHDYWAQAISRGHHFGGVPPLYFGLLGQVPDFAPVEHGERFRALHHVHVARLPVVVRVVVHHAQWHPVHHQRRPELHLPVLLAEYFATFLQLPVVLLHILAIAASSEPPRGRADRKPQGLEI